MLEIKNLTCGYDNRFFLREINLKVMRKELIGIIGPNGSGKTTLIRAMARLLKPKQGSIILEGHDIWGMNFKELAKKIAIVSQSQPAVAMTVEDYVLLGRVPHFTGLQFLETKEDLRIAQRAMLLTDTLKFKERLLDELSGGERQLVLIARALAQEPKLLILDEPTTHLDITHQVIILDLLKKLNRQLNLTVIMVLHDLNLASEYCERLILISEGRIHCQGNPEEVMQYQLIEEVYKTVVVVQKNPISRKPFILMVSKEVSEQENN